MGQKAKISILTFCEPGENPGNRFEPKTNNLTKRWQSRILLAVADDDDDDEVDYRSSGAHATLSQNCLVQTLEEIAPLSLSRSFFHSHTLSLSHAPASFSTLSYPSLSLKHTPFLSFFLSLSVFVRIFLSLHLSYSLLSHDHRECLFLFMLFLLLFLSFCFSPFRIGSLGGWPPMTTTFLRDLEETFWCVPASTSFCFPHLWL